MSKTQSERQREYEKTRSKIMIPKALKALLMAKAEASDLTIESLLYRYVTASDLTELSGTPAASDLTELSGTPAASDLTELSGTLEQQVLRLVRDNHRGHARTVIDWYGGNSAAFKAIAKFAAFEYPYPKRHLCTTDVGRTLARLRNCISATKPKPNRNIKTIQLSRDK